jgi:hypothetical protein
MPTPRATDAVLRRLAGVLRVHGTMVSICAEGKRSLETKLLRMAVSAAFVLHEVLTAGVCVQFLPVSR